MSTSTSRRKTTLVHMGIQAFLAVYAIVSGIALVPLYLEHIQPELYGAWQATGNVVGWMSLFDPGLSTILQQRVAGAHGANDKESIGQWVTAGLLMTVLVVATILVTGMTVSYFLGDLLKLPAGLDVQALESAFRWVVLGTAMMVMSFSFATASQGLQASVGIGLIAVLSMGSRLLLVIYMVSAGYGLYGIAIPTAVMGAINLGAHVYYLRRRMRIEQVRWTWGLGRLRELRGLMGLTSLSRIASVMAANMDLFVVARMLGPESVNTLRFSRTATETSRMLVERPVAAIQPALAHMLGSPDRHRAGELVQRFLRLEVWLLALLLAGFLALNEHFVGIWVGAEYYGGTALNGMIVVTFLSVTALNGMSSLCFTAGGIRESSLVSAAQVAIYLPAVWIGTRYFGMRGAVAASFISVVIAQGLTLPKLLAERYGFTRTDGMRLARTAAGAAAAALGAWLVGRNLAPGTWLQFLLATTAMAGTYVALLFTLSPSARAEVTAVLARFRRR